MENHIAETTIFLNDENKFDDQIRLEYFKYKLRNIFSLSQAKKNREMKNLEH